MNNIVYNLTGNIISETENGINFDISQRIKSFNISSNYSEYVFPVSYIDVFITIDEFRAISNKDIEIVMSLKKLGLNDESNQLIDDYEYIFKDKVFDVVNEDNLIIQKPANEDLRKKEQSNLLVCRFVLLAKEDMEASKVNAFGNYINCDLGNVISFLVTKLNQNKKTIIQELDNSVVYDQVIVPFNTVLRNLVYLDTVYGLYENGLKLFMDFDMNYILNRNVNNIKNHTKTITIEVTNNEDSLNPTSIPNSMKVLYSNIIYNTNKKAMKEMMGTNVNTVVPSENLRISTLEYFESDKTKVYYQTYSNPFTANSLNPNNDTLVKINVVNTDINYFNFVNDYIITLPTKEFEGMQFNLTNYSHKLVKNNQGYYELFSTASLRKII